MIKLRLLDLYEKIAFHYIGPKLRQMGQWINVRGLALQGDLTSDDRGKQIICHKPQVVPSLRCKPHNKVYPNLNLTKFVAPNSVVVGSVNLGQESSIWYGSTIRGDLNKISVGKNSIIQDKTTLQPNEDKSVEIGDDVYIGPNAVLESCKIENHAFIGMGSSIRHGAKVESYGVVAAGAVIPENSTVASYQNKIWAGNPAKYLRDLTNEEKEVLDEFLSEMHSLAKVHAEEAEKTFRQVIDDLDQKEEESHYDPEDWALQKAKELGFPMEAEDEDYVEQRIFMREHEPTEEQYWKKNYDPYEQDLYHFPDSFKPYGENYERYEELKKYFAENPNAKVQQMERKERIGPKDNTPWEKKFQDK